MSIEPWNTAAGGRAGCEDMPRKSVDKRLTDNPVQQKRGRLRPFPAIRRGRVRAEPANGSRDESLVGFGATPKGLKTTNICNFRGSFEPIFLTQFFHRLFDTTFNKIFTNHPKSVILFYSEVFFYQPSFLEFPIFELYRKLHDVTKTEYTDTLFLNPTAVPI